MKTIKTNNNTKQVYNFEEFISLCMLVMRAAGSLIFDKFKGCIKKVQKQLTKNQKNMKKDFDFLEFILYALSMLAIFTAILINLILFLKN